MQLQDENQLTLIVLKVKGVITSFSCVMIFFFFKHIKKKKIPGKKEWQTKQDVKKIAKLCQKGKKMKNKSQNSRKKRLTVLRYGT